jgi:hypothetical protein
MDDKVYFAISANHFFERPIPDCKEHVLECKTHDEIRKHVSAERLPDEELRKKPLPFQITFQARHLVHRAVKELCVEEKGLFEEVNQALQAEAGNKALIAGLKVQDLLAKALAHFQKNKSGEKYQLLAERYHLPLSTIIEVVLPKVLAEQARSFLDANVKQYMDAFPVLEDLFYRARNNVFRPCRLPPPNFKFDDALYPDYLANAIWGTCLSTFAAPAETKEVELMLKNTVFNTRCPTSHMVVAADRFVGAPEGADLFNYFFHTLNSQHTFGQYQVTVKKLEGNVRLHRPLAELKLDPTESRTAKISLEVLETKTNTPKNLVVYYFKTRHAGSLSLTNVADFALLKEVYEVSRSQYVGVQSSVASSNRSGQMVLLLELTHYLQQNAARLNTRNVGAAIHHVLQELRKNDPLLISNPAIYWDAVHYALLLYSHLSANKTLEHLSKVHNMSRSQYATPYATAPAVSHSAQLEHKSGLSQQTMFQGSRSAETIRGQVAVTSLGPGQMVRMENSQLIRTSIGRLPTAGLSSRATVSSRSSLSLSGADSAASAEDGQTNLQASDTKLAEGVTSLADAVVDTDHVSKAGVKRLLFKKRYRCLARHCECFSAKQSRF